MVAHPLVSSDRNIRRAVWVPVSDSEGTLIGSLLSLNPKYTRRRTRNQILAKLLDLARAIRVNLVATRRKMMQSDEDLDLPAWELSEPNSTRFAYRADDVLADRSDPVSKFLQNTLVCRSQLRHRGNVAYTVIRQWRKPIERYQMDALKSLKNNPPLDFVDRIAEDLENGLRRQIGNSKVASVVPVPCGHSKRSDCLSVLIARNLAARIGSEVCEAFLPQHRDGVSHPKQSARLRKYKILEIPKSPAVVIDDVATSGRHIEQAVEQLRGKADVVSALVWLGGDATGQRI